MVKSLEFSRAKSTEALGDQVRRRAGRFSDGIAEFEVLRDPWCFTNCDDTLSHLHSQLPGIEIFESVDAHAEGGA
jgi:hypothetical protein